MKRLILIILVLGLIVFAIHKSGYCPMSRRAHGAPPHKAYFKVGRRDRRAERREYAAVPHRAEDAFARRTAVVDFRVPDDELDDRETVDGLPVPIVPGTRTADASPTAPRPPEPPQPPKPPRRAPGARNAPGKLHAAVGRISATEDRARADALRQLREDVAAWLDPQVPPSWEISGDRLEALIVETRVTPVEKPYATLYVAELRADFSDARRAALVDAYQQTVVRGRMLTLAALLAFVLVCLAAVSGYIRADEATRGYYTNRLRLLAAAGVGAAGAVIYQMIS